MKLNVRFVRLDAMTRALLDTGGKRLEAGELTVLPPAPPGSGLLLVQGRAPLCLYAAAALSWQGPGMAILYPNPERDCYVVVSRGESPHPPGTCLCPRTLRPLPAPLSGETRVALEARSTDDRVLVGLTPGRNLSPACLRDLEEALREALPVAAPRLLVWHAPAPTWLAATWALNCARMWPEAAVAVSCTQLGGGVVVRADRDATRPPGTVVRPGAHRGTRPTLAGIVGDPNSGKSVFSWKLYRCLSRRGFRAYRLDCDVRAPTCLWGLSPLGRNLREAQKRDWNDREDVPQLVKAIGCLRESDLEIVLLDLPGGLHAAGRARRIPPGRERLFAAIDRYIVVQKSDAIAKAWCQEIRARHPRAVFDAEIISRRDGSGRSDPGRGRFAVAPLRREAITTPDPAIAAVADHLLRAWSLPRPGD